MSNQRAAGLNLARKTLLGCVAIFAVATPLSIGLLIAQSQPAPAGPAQKFDVASIRPCINGGGPGGGGRGSDRAGTASAPPRPAAATSGRFTMSCVAVNTLINMAYVRFAGHFDPNSPIAITGGPDWIKPGLGPNFSSSDRYTIQAEAVGNPSQEIMRGPMLRSLLEDRFNLKLHRETKDVPAYALTVAKGKAKLKPYDGQCFNMDFTKFPLKGPEDPNQPPCEHGAGRKGPDIAVALQADSLASFAGVLGSLIGRPIVDKTGISGLFDFELEYGPDENSPQSFATDYCAVKPTLPICKTNTGTASDPAGPSIFTVLEKQFGLKLEPTTGSKEFLIIDHIERPSEN